jgi:hypothetical protein
MRTYRPCPGVERCSSLLDYAGQGLSDNGDLAELAERVTKGA